jgi:hypothetical protein
MVYFKTDPIISLIITPAKTTPNIKRNGDDKLSTTSFVELAKLVVKLSGKIINVSITRVARNTPIYLHCLLFRYYGNDKPYNCKGNNNTKH